MDWLMIDDHTHWIHMTLLQIMLVYTTWFKHKLLMMTPTVT